MRSRLILAATLLLAPGVVAQSSPRAKPIRQLSSMRGAVTFAVPGDWHVLQETDGDSIARFIYHVVDPATDTVGPARTNVLVIVERRPGSRTFKAFTDSMLGGLIDRSTLVLDDSIAGPAQRAVFWRGTERSTVYVGYDDFARDGDIWVHVRIALPLTQHSTPDWSTKFAKQAGTLIRSVRFKGRPAFPVDFGYPVLSMYGPVE